MTSYRLSRRAQSDLDQIFDCTLDTYGLTQARRYRDSLVRAVDALAANPRMGRLAPADGRGIRRHEHQRHIILDEVSGGGIIIQSFVHARRKIAPIW